MTFLFFGLGLRSAASDSVGGRGAREETHTMKEMQWGCFSIYVDTVHSTQAAALTASSFEAPPEGKLVSDDAARR